MVVYEQNLSESLNIVANDKIFDWYALEDPMATLVCRTYQKDCTAKPVTDT